MHGIARIGIRILLSVSLLAAGATSFYFYQRSQEGKARLERRMADLEEQLAQEVAIRQVLLQDKRAPIPAQGDWRADLAEKDKQILYLRSVIERMALGAPSVKGMPQTRLEEMPTPPMPAIASNQVMGEVTQVSPEHGYMFINRGQKHGVTPSMRFEVYRKGQKVGQVQTGIIYDTVSSVTASDGLEAFEKGDMIRSTES